MALEGIKYACGNAYQCLPAGGNPCPKEGPSPPRVCVCVCVCVCVRCGCARVRVVSGYERGCVCVNMSVCSP
jgi:hypothetical protein